MSVAGVFGDVLLRVVVLERDVALDVAGLDQGAAGVARVVLREARLLGATELTFRLPKDYRNRSRRCEFSSWVPPRRILAVPLTILSWDGGPGPEPSWSTARPSTAPGRATPAWPAPRPCGSSGTTESSTPRACL